MEPVRPLIRKLSQTTGESKPFISVTNSENLNVSQSVLLSQQVKKTRDKREKNGTVSGMDKELLIFEARKY